MSFFWCQVFPWCVALAGKAGEYGKCPASLQEFRCSALSYRTPSTSRATHPTQRCSCLGARHLEGKQVSVGCAWNLTRDLGVGHSA